MQLQPPDSSQEPAWANVLEFSQLAALCSAPLGLEAYSPLLGKPCLVFAVPEQSGAVERVDCSEVVAQLRRLPCPVIALGALLPAALERGVDVFLPTLAAARAVLRNIETHPLTAMTLVQLLRHNEDVDPLAGLLAESFAYASLQAGVEFARVLQSPQFARKAAAESAGARGQPATTEDASPVLLERSGDNLAITLNRPLFRNAYSVAMRDALYDALTLLRADPALQRAVISGRGDCFSVGGDLSEFGGGADPSTAHAIRSSRSVGQLLLQLAPQLEFQLHGACIGAGIELPAFAARVSARRCTFVQLPEIRYGLLPGAGGSVSILRRIGRQRTAYLALSARKLKATTALEWGLVDTIVD